MATVNVNTLPNDNVRYITKVITWDSASTRTGAADTHVMCNLSPVRVKLSTANGNKETLGQGNGEFGIALLSKCKFILGLVGTIY